MLDEASRIVRQRHDEIDRDAFTDMEQEAVKVSLANLRTFPWIRMKENSRELSLHGVWFDIAMGELHAYDEDVAQGSAMGGGTA